MTPKAARAMLLTLATHMDEVRATMLAEDESPAASLHRLNRVAWLGEVMTRHGDTIRIALGQPVAATKPEGAPR